MVSARNTLKKLGNGLYQIAEKKSTQYGAAVALFVPGLLALKEMLFNEEYVRDTLLTWREKVMTAEQYYAKYPLCDLNDAAAIILPVVAAVILGGRLCSDKELIKYWAREATDKFSSRIVNPVKKFSRKVANHTIAMHGYKMFSH